MASHALFSGEAGAERQCATDGYLQEVAFSPELIKKIKMDDQLRYSFHSSWFTGMTNPHIESTHIQPTSHLRSHAVATRNMLRHAAQQ